MHVATFSNAKHLKSRPFRRGRVWLTVGAAALGGFSLSAAEAPSVPAAASGNLALAAIPAAALPASSPEMQAQQGLRNYLEAVEPRRLEPLRALALDRAGLLTRIHTLELAVQNAQTVAAQPAVDLAEAYLLYLTDFAPDPKDYVDTLAHLSQLLGGRNDQAPLLTLLYELSERFPHASPAVLQMQLAEAEFLLRANLPQPALVLLHNLGQETDIPSAAQVLAMGRAGFLHERLGQPEEAIKAYEQTGKYLSTLAQADEASLREVLLLLELGRTDEAIAVLNKMRAVPADVLRGTQAAPVIADLVALTANPDEAKAYWLNQEKWNAQWRKLATDLNLKLDEPGPAMAPYIDDYRRVTLESTTALNQKDRTLYFQIINLLLRSAHWRPADLALAGTLLYQGVPLAPDQRDAILALGRVLAQSMPPGMPNLSKQLLQLHAATLMDAGQMAEARDVLADALARYGVDGAQGQALTRLFGFAVLRTDSTVAMMTDAARLLAESLVDPEAHQQQRSFAINVLCELYLRLKRDNDAIALLQKELTQPARASTGGDRYLTAVRDTLTQVQQRQVQAQGLDASLSAWWSRFELPWYTYVTTAQKAGTLISVDGGEVRVAEDFSRALDPNVTPTDRTASLLEAWNLFPAMPLTGGAMTDAVSDFIGRNELPAELRYVAWVKSIWHLLWTNQRAAAEKLLASMPAGAPEAAQDRPDIDLWLDYLASPTTPGAQRAFADKVLAHAKLSQADIVLVVRIIESLARAGVPDGAEAVYQKLQLSPMDLAAMQQFQQLQSNIGPLITQYRSTQPAYAALRQIVVDAAGPAAAAAQLPERWRNLNDSTQPDLDLLTKDEARQGLLAVIRDHLPYGRHPLQVFLDYGQALPMDAASNTVRFHLFEAVQTNVTRDDDRFYAALFADLVDFDDPDLARRGWTILAPSRADQFPRAAGFIQYYDTLMKWRTGSPIDPAKAFGSLSAPHLEAFKLRLAVDYYLQHDEQGSLQDLLKARPEDEFLSMPVLPSYLRALRVLGKEAALTRAADAARAEISKAVVESWAQPSHEQAEPVFELARVLRDPAAYPRAWVDYELGVLRNENALDLFRLSDAQLRRDWPTVLSAADSFLARNPTTYDLYWPKAQALVGLNRNQEALAPLRLYVKYSHNEQDYQEAADLLKKLEGASAAAGATASASTTAAAAARPVGR